MNNNQPNNQPPKPSNSGTPAPGNPSASNISNSGPRPRFQYRGHNRGGGTHTRTLRPDAAPR
ncbi:MAG: hypothetical protein AAB365_03500, partial [Patescibacteria group bacterium]